MPGLLLNRLVDEAALRDPSAPAIRCDGDTLTYEQLARRGNGLARVLLETGLSRGDRVAVWLGKGLEVPVSFYGALSAGATLVPIDPKSPVEQAVRIMRATGATHLIAEPSRRAAVCQAMDACPDVTHVIGLAADEAMRVPCVAWETVLEQSSDRPPDVSVIELDPAYILHTSGSTGLPKLILHTHYGAMSFVEWAASTYALRSDDRLTNHSSHHTCFATFDYYAAARAGATTVILTPAVLMMPGSLSAVLERERVSVWYSVPAALVQLSLRGDLEARNLRPLRWVLFAGETFPGRHLQRIRQQLPGARFSHVYGSTEVNVCTCFHLPETGDPVGPLPIGRACATTRTLVADAALQPVPDGDVGELFVRGSTVMAGYWDDPERTREVLVRRPGGGGLDEVYFKTGDRARVLPDGNLAFVARADRQVKVRGHRVELDEVEAALLSLASVEEAAVFTVPDGEGSSALHAAVVVGGDTPPAARDMLANLRRSLPSYALPSEIAVVDALPRTPTGKVDLRALGGQVTERTTRDGD
jgi:amino acid adenylation domain-containing protein